MFVLSGPVLRFGRAGLGQTDPGPPDNTLVLRVLPCRSAALDPENHRLSCGISRSHGAIDLRDGAAYLVHRSRGWITVNDIAVPAGTPTRLPERFRLSLSGVLTLEGRLVRAADDPRRAVQAVLLRRLANLPQHAYLWVSSLAVLGPEDGSALGLHPPHRGRIDAVGAALSISLSAALSAHESPPAEEARS